MTKAYRLDIFKTEINSIHSYNIRNIVTNTLANIPDYFFYIPASSSGKYHPEFALGPGGLVRHVKAAVKIARDLFILEQEDLNEHEQDIATATLILHDCFKAGKDETAYSEKKEYRTISEHPVLMHDYLIDNFKNDPDAKAIADAILTHMGQWNKFYKSEEEFAPKPSTKLQKFVHLCDFIASRKGLEVDTDYTPTR